MDGRNVERGKKYSDSLRSRSFKKCFLYHRLPAEEKENEIYRGIFLRQGEKEHNKAKFILHSTIEIV